MFSHAGGDIGIGGITANRAAQEGVDNSHNTDYAAGSCTSSSSHNSVEIEFDNPLYSEWGPVTVREGDHEYVSCLPFCISPYPWFLSMYMHTPVLSTEWCCKCIYTTFLSDSFHPIIYIGSYRADRKET